MGRLITYPLNPYLAGSSTILQRAAPQAIGINALTAISFDTVDRDDLGIWAPATPTRLTVGRWGDYIVGAGIVWSATGAGVTLRIRVNGATVVTQHNRSGWDSTPLRDTCERPVRLSAGDYIEVMVLNKTDARNVTGRLYLVRG